MTNHSRRLRRNVAVAIVTGLLLVLLFLYPTSTNHLGARADSHIEGI